MRFVSDGHGPLDVHRSYVFSWCNHAGKGGRSGPAGCRTVFVQSRLSTIVYPYYISSAPEGRLPLFIDSWCVVALDKAPSRGIDCYGCWYRLRLRIRVHFRLRWSISGRFRPCTRPRVFSCDVRRSTSELRGTS